MAGFGADAEGEWLGSHGCIPNKWDSLKDSCTVQKETLVHLTLCRVLTRSCSLMRESYSICTPVSDTRDCS